jgi:SAM-dependent methyltransferase
MKQFQSLDDIIALEATAFAGLLTAAAAAAVTEADIRTETVRQLAFIEKEAGVKLEGRHEFTVASGRVDSVYQRVIIEYKNPSGPDHIDLRPDSPGTRKVVEQIKKRFYDLRKEHGQPLNSLFGVGLDGRYFVFVRFRDDKWQVQDPVEVNKVSAARFLWALFNLGRKGKPFSPEYLAGDFGSEGKLAQDGIHTLYHAIATATHPKAQVFFSQWKILFGEVCGYDVDNPSDKIKKLADFYGVPLKGLKPAELLFAVHTYYALFMKLLASEIVAFFHRLPTPLQKMMEATTSAKLKREMEELEAGSIFRHLNITNFLEGDLFAWYVPVWSDPIEKLVRAMVAKLDDYNPGTLSEDPVGSRDLLKRLYQELFPKTVRRSTGEHYTPDWLAEHVLNEVGYTGDPDKRMLDPGCGSGTFLVMAINRIRAWYDANREKCAFGEDDLCRKILANVIGFDLNPLAVMAARTNYLIAIRDLIGHVDKVELPVYLCDSILTPSTYGGLFAGTTGAAKELKTAAAKFLIPTEIATSRDGVAKYAEQLESCVRNGLSPKEFIERCQEEGLPVSARNLHTDLYKELVRLDKANKNGVWARIIKNAFAPLFTGLVDYVIGNPPWVNWESLPADYRESTIGLWDKYRLRERATPGARLGNVKKELSALFVYVCIDHYLAPGGQLAFLITQSVFKTGANEGFRRFSCGENKPFRVTSVSDLSLCLPFENAVNRTAILLAEKGERTEYPVPYRMWIPKRPRSSVHEADLEAVLKTFTIEDWQAGPVEPSVRESAWLTAPAKAFPIMRKIIGDRDPGVMGRTYAGSCTWLNGVYWVEPVETKRGTLIRNLGSIGKTKVRCVTAAVENVFLFPLLRGRDVHAWLALPSGLILIPHRRDDFGEPVSLGELKRKAPLTHEFLKGFEDELRARSGYRQLHKDRAEYYVVGNLGKYTLADFKVIFKELTEVFQCSVVEPSTAKGSDPRPVVPDHKLSFITCGEQDEAYFLAGVLNSIPARTALYSASVGVQTQSYYPTDVSRIRLPGYTPKDAAHREIVRLSKGCHRAATAEEPKTLAKLEIELAEASAQIWGLSRKELRSLVAYYNEILTFRSSGRDIERSEE